MTGPVLLKDLVRTEDPPKIRWRLKDPVPALRLWQ